MNELRDIIWIDEDRMSGAPCFRGTRVPVKTLPTYLAHCDSVDAFLDDFPSVKRDMAVRYLELAEEHAVEHAK